MPRPLKMDPKDFYEDMDIGALRSSAKLLLLALLAHADDDGTISVGVPALRANIGRFLERWDDEMITADVNRILHALRGRAGLVPQEDGARLVFDRVYLASWCYKVPIPKALRSAVFERDGYTCLACGATEGLAADHVVAESLGGPTTLENLQTLCTPCNQRKRTKAIDYRKAANHG